ncbi:MAG TPA: HAMP domain-containing sensor histidine kinase [Ktedonosporobacter sp.]|nr:HAMP domain-containing sensor histidine kinase [Ktedonosporobacter sp.]
MDRVDEYPHQPPYPDIVSALADFSRLAQQVLASSTPATAESFALALLKRVLHLCKRQRGALLLATRYHETSKPSFWVSLTERKTLRVLARDGLTDDELFALLTTFTGSGEIQASSTEPGWAICQHLLPAPGSLHQERHSPGEPFSLLSSTLSFFVLAGPDTTNTLSPQAALERMQALWPLVIDAVSTVIVSLLQAEKMFELETVAGQRDLQQMELLKAELLATVSHELRSPLASIQGYTATLLRHEKRIAREERHEFLLAIQDASQRLHIVIDRLLEMSQLETSTLPLQREPVNLIHLARETIAVMQQRLGEANASSSEKDPPVSPNRFTFRLRVEDSHGKPIDDLPVLQADRRLLHEAVDHLVENAVLYSPKGGTIEIGLRAKAPDQVKLLSQRLAHPSPSHRKAMIFSSSWPGNRSMIELWVQDQGMGIADTHLEQIFQQFYRVDTSLTREVNRLGLGLAMCKRIVELHDGLLWAESEIGQGSTFHILLPVDGPSLSA